MGTDKQEVAITGISGKFPECYSVEDLKEKLFSKSILLKPDKARKLNFDKETINLTSGKMPEWNKFDNSFFGMPSRLVRNTDPMLGLMIERTFEAILDAGYNPFALKGRNVAVLTAPSPSDIEQMNLMDESGFKEGSRIVGNSRAMLANKISFFFNFKGPSHSYEGSWVSSMHCLDIAVAKVASGEVEAAVVATVNHLFSSSFDANLYGMGLIAEDGLCQPFDDEGHGFVRSEAAVAFFIQRSRDAKRIYGTVKDIQTKFMGARTCGFIQIDPEIHVFLKGFYNNISEKPEDVSYVEAHGTCVKDLDKQELNAFAGVFCSKKETPQLIGSIFGNIGSSDNCSGLVSTVKAILAMETGIIPPTVNYHTPNSDVPALVSGKLKPLTEETALPGDLVAVNNLSCFGGFSHLLLKRHDKVKKVQGPKELPEDGLPRLVLLQARHEEGVRAACQKISSMTVDVEFVSLVNDVFKTEIPAYLWRGYTVIPAPKEKPVTKFQELNPTKRPLWFVFSGIGSQWTAMGKELLQIPEFKTSIEKCDNVLQPKGIDIVDILSSEDSTIFDNILNSFVGITAVQIGLVDILTKLNVTPDGIIGHSVGELGCAYADGCFTAEETILAAYSRGKASLDSLDNDYIKGMMAAVGIGYSDIKDKLPPSIDVACHNSRQSCTLSGPADDINTFVNKLQSDGVFARAVSAGGIAYHSRYIRAIAPRLLKLLEELVPNPKPRSSKWISTSVPESQWNTDSAKFCSPEYLTNNLLNPVYFEEGCRHLPDNAILVEIAPHGLLQAILRRSVSSKSLNLSLTSRTAGSNLNKFLECLGELYLNNVSIDINALYPKMDHPVSRGTPSLASLASWDHEVDQYSDFVSFLNMITHKGSYGKTTMVHPSVPEYRFWKNHCLNGQVVLSTAQILVYPWEMILASKYQNIEQSYTVFEDVTIGGNISVNECESLLYSTFSPSSLKFEVSYLIDNNVEIGSVILSGKLVEAKPQPLIMPETSGDLSTMQELSQTEVYFTLSELGFNLGHQFQIIKKLYIGKKECIAILKWNGNIITFLDSLMKIIVIFKSQEKGQLLQPNSLTKLTIDGRFLMSLSLETELEVHYQSRCNRVVCPGAEILGLTLSPPIHSDLSALSWSELRFQPFFDSKVMVEEFLSYCIQTVAEDGFKSWKDNSCKIIVLITESNSLSQYIHMFKHNMKYPSNIEVKILQVDLEAAKKQIRQAGRESFVVVGEYNSLAGLVAGTETFYCITHYSNNGSPKYSQALKPISVCQTDSGKLALLKKVKHKAEPLVFKTESREWLNDLRRFLREMKKNDVLIILVTQNLTPRQVLPALSKEPYVHMISTVFIQDCDAPQFSLSAHFYSSQLSLGLSVNILSGGVWGSLRSTSLNLSPCDFNPNSLFTSSNENLSVNCVGLNTTFCTYHLEPSTKELKLEYLDYSGVQRGQRVMGVGYFKPESNSLRPDPILEWPVPAGWTTEDAASVPVLYTLAYYCINLKARVEKGEHVLVHAGMTPLGQAVISVTLQAGCEVIVSVVDEEDALLLTKQFPSVKRSQLFVLDKEDINIAVRKRTGGKGVQVIINCLLGKDFQSTIKIADKDCRIIVLAETRIEDREIIGLYNFFENKSAHGISLRSIDQCSNECKMNLRKEIQIGIEQGIVRPLRKRMFHPHNFTNAMCNLQVSHSTEKTILVFKHENPIQPQNGFFLCNSEDIHIIAGEEPELKFKLAEWLTKHGAKNIILLNSKEYTGSRYLRRIIHLINRHKCSTVIAPSSCLDTVETAKRFLKETSHIGPVSSIFCVCMDENSNKMKNLDDASREVLPRLQQFVSLLGSGTAVCNSRADVKLPTCCIRGDCSSESSANILPYLISLMSDSQREAKFFFVSDHFGSLKIQDVIDCFGYLPNSVEDLYAYGESIESQPRFLEEVTRSPQYSMVKYCLLPVFMIPGLGQHSVKPLLRQLMHPAFCCRLSADNLSIQELAELLVQDITGIQTRGPYNIVGESWGGALALTVAHLLEAQGSQVNLILIQGIPTTAQSRLRAMCKKYDADLATCILNVALKSQAQNASHSSWSERLAQLLSSLEPLVREPVSKAVTTLSNQLSSFLQFKPFDQLYKGDITLIRNKNEPLLDFENIFKFCEKSPKIVTVAETNYSQLLTSFMTVTAINEHVAHTWSP